MGDGGVYGPRAAILLTLLWTAGACAPFDAPRTLAGEAPQGAVEWLVPDTLRGERIGDGTWYWYMWSAEGPWAVHIVEADMGRCDLALETLQSEAREGGGRGHEEVRDMVARSGGALAAVNADFFTPEGMALGTEVVDGIVTSARERPTLSWRRGVGPWMGDARIEGDSINTGWPIHLRRGDGSTEAVGGFPEILDGGLRVGDLMVKENPGFALSRHPRTAIGFDPYSNRLWMIVVDGRQAYSVGMSLPELATLLESIGAVEAINLDGGGSSTMVVRGETVNRPSDESGERPVVNALALIRDVSGCSR